MKKLSIAVFLAAIPASFWASGASAKTDPAGDFLGTYEGPLNTDLDFTSAAVRLNGSAFDLSLTLAGPASGSANVLYVWGIDRGAGTPRLNALPGPDLDANVKWDSVAVLFGNGTLRVVTFPQAGAPTFTNFAGGAVFNGNSVTASVPLALLPSRGFTPDDYRFQLWSRYRTNPALDGSNTEIADFGPRMTAQVPEPASWAMMILGFAAVGFARRRQIRVAYG